ncbi:hypothetical protein [Vibrio sp. SCSIO 43009]|uniref:hypothetical protein n=1 Tax=Vibrio sp. SCSIO 43009 TaxID=2819103 RepID=UPI0020751C2A|nr:hypothetical protein [Vibrio sp. SCSIO 43009]
MQGIGFFLGGTSMLMLSGAQISPEKYRTSCHNATNVDCHWLRENNVDITSIPDQKFPRFQSENKLKSVVVINPELTKTFVPETLALMNNAITVVTLSDRLHPALTPAESLVESSQCDVSRDFLVRVSLVRSQNVLSVALKFSHQKGRKHFARSVTRFPERTIISTFWM